MRAFAIGSLSVVILIAALTMRGSGGGAARTQMRAPTLAGARTFFFDELEAKLHGRYGTAWSTLYPGYQRMVPRVVYVRCEIATPFPAPLQALDVIRVRRTHVRIPGVARRLPGAAITLRVALTWYGPRDPIVVRPTFHLVAVHGRWRWVLSPERYHAFRTHTCGALPAV